MKNSPLLDKSLEFATMIVLFYEAYSKSKKDTTIPKQLLRSGTSVGANLNEAIYGNSKADFISKLHISLKEVGESIYWLKLLERTNIFEYNYQEMIFLAEEIRRMLIASLNTAKNKNLLTDKSEFGERYNSADWWYENVVSGDGKNGIFRAVSVNFISP